MLYAPERAPQQAPQQSPFQAPFKAQADTPQVNWYLRLTSSGWDSPQETIQERERARRSRLTAWIVLGLFIVDMILIPTANGDPASIIGIAVGALSLVIVAALNRFGLVTVAGSVLVVVIIAIVFGVVVGVSEDPVTKAPAGQLSLNLLPTFDLLAMAVLVAASILPRPMTFIVAGLNSALIWLDFVLQTPAPDLAAYIHAQGVIAQVARPIGLQLIIATVAYLWVRGTDDAIRRADRAEELAAVEHQLVEQKRQLDQGIRQILDVHVRIANGDYNARAPLTQDNVLFQIAASLNTLLNRLGRAAQAEYFMQRTAGEIARLRESLLAARAGRQPLWPAPSGTPVDALIEVLATPPAQRPPSQLPPSGMGGMGGIGGITTAGLNPPQGANSGPLVARAINSGPFRTPGVGSQPMGTPPFGGTQGGGGYDYPGQPGAHGVNSGPGGPRPMGGPGFGAPNSGRGMPGPNSGPNSGPNAPGGQAGQGGQGGGQHSSSWQLPDMPPLPDWLMPSDDER